MNNKQPKWFAAIALLSLLAMLSFGLFSAPAAQATGSTTITVTESDVARQIEDSPPTKSWVIYTRLASPGTATFVSGPGMPPLGAGSLEFMTTTGSDKVYALNFDHVGTPLGDVNAIGYSTYRSAGSAQQVAALNIQVDVNGLAAPGGFTTLVFEPVYNTGQGAVVSGQWQTWNAYMGGNATWWSSNPINGAPNRDTFVSWNTIVAANPDAVVLGVGINQGSGNPGLTTAVDAFTFGTTTGSVTYDFEKFKVATTKDDCKNGGWQTVKRTDGSSFKNQGDCVSYTNNGK